jgi:N-acyl-phosphatidylethanolamine-hydrolysing phospholipase D
MFPARASAFDSPRGRQDLLTVTWIGHATALLQLGRVNILTDPMWSNRASPVSWMGPARFTPPGVRLELLPPLDLILLSHNHYDHLDRRTVRELARQQPTAIWCAPLGLARLLTAWGVRDVRELDWWDEVRTANATVACVPARHFSARGFHDRGATLWCGWTVAADGWRAYFAGDTAYHPEFGSIARTYGPLDVALLPVGAYEPRWFMGSVHMNPEDAVRGYRDLCDAQAPAPCPAMVPIHWGTFRLTDEPVDEPPARTRTRWREAGLPDDALWLLAHGETRRRDRAG